MDFFDDDERFIDLVGGAWAACPYCGEEVELIIDPGGGAHQDYVEDCEVCCRPWRVDLRVQPDGTPFVTLSTLDEG
ncbi:MAG: CPXCG motif-containing cysteine-rich protein [Longimicrobiales bacterium]